MNESKTVELEIVADDKLIKFADKTGLEKTSTSALVSAFQPIFAKARTAITDAQGVAESVKDATCVKEIRKSRECRLALRAVRIESDNVRKRQKEHALLYGRAVDGFHNILLADLSPVETALQEAEDIAERAEAARLAALKSTREKELQPYLEAPILNDLSQLSEKDYAQTLSDAKLLKQAKLDAIAKAKAEAEADRIERERIAAENARLKAEAEAREAAAKSEREEAARKLAAEQKAAREAQEAAELARKAAEATARKEREAIEAKAKAEREALEAKVKAEREAAEVESKKERLRLQALAEVERQKLAAAEAEAKALREAQAKKSAEVAATEKKAAAAPDNAKAKAFADTLRALPLPQFKSSKAFDAIPSKIETLAKWIESQIETEELL